MTREQDRSGDEGSGGASQADTADMRASIPGKAETLAERVDAVPASPPQTMLGGVGLPTKPSQATALMHAAPRPAEEPAGPADLTGKIVKGRYLIKRLLGSGGMGGVYEGEHLEIGRRVAIKIVSSIHGRDPHIAARIKQEARSTGAIESEHIVQVFDAGEDDELGLFLVMELLNGEDLSATLAREHGLPPLTAISFIAQAAQGLARAHAARIVHRDLKPANIFICKRDDGTSLVKLVDFGIAKLLRDASDKQAGGLTRMGMVIGTPQYMSPEQAQGLPTVDHRTDIYSLGAVLFEVITGRSPFAEMPTYEQTILQIMMKKAPRLSSVVPDVLPSVDALCADMMAHDAAARPQEMSEVRERLQRILAEMGAPSTGDTTGAAARDASGGWRGSVSGADDHASRAAAAAARMASPGTVAAVAVDPHDEAPPSIAGLPRRRSGSVAIAALVGGAAIAGAFMLLRTPGTHAVAASGEVHGIVEAPVIPPPQVTPSSAPVAVVTREPSASAAPVPPVASAPPASSAVAVAAPAEPAKPPPAPVKPKSTKPSRRVGSTEVVDDF